MILWSGGLNGLQRRMRRAVHTSVYGGGVLGAEKYSGLAFRIQNKFHRNPPSEQGELG